MLVVGFSYLFGASTPDWVKERFDFSFKKEPCPGSVDEIDAISHYLHLMDSSTRNLHSPVEEISDIQLWQRPAPKEWSIGEILDHNYLLFASMHPAVQWHWKLNGWYGRLRRNRPYKAEIEIWYRSPKFPPPGSAFWDAPRHNTRQPVSLNVLKSEIRNMHAKVHQFYAAKDEETVGNLDLYDPVFGWCNLIVTLRIGIYHDQLHYDDVIKQAGGFKK